MLASSALLCTGNGFGRSVLSVCGASPLICDKIDLRMSFFWVTGVAVAFSRDDFWMIVFGVAGVSNRRNARTR